MFFFVMNKINDNPKVDWTTSEFGRGTRIYFVQITQLSSYLESHWTSDEEVATHF